jgi:drug/metabolite transporter (DMT)-like permease
LSPVPLPLPGTLVAIRALVAIVLLGGYMLARRKPVALPASLLPLIVLATVFSATMNYAFLSAMYSIDIGLTILVLFSHPFLVALYYHVNGTTRITPLRLAWTVLAFIGLAMALAVSFADIDKTGLALACLSAVACTGMVITMVRVNETVGGLTTNFHLALWSCLIFAAALAFTGDVAWPRSAAGWLFSAGNGVAWIIAYVVFLAAVRLIGAARATVLTFMEPVATIVLAALLFGERMSLVQWAGVGLVALGLFFLEADLSMFRRRRSLD